MMAFPTLEDIVVHEPQDEERIQRLLQEEEHHMPPPVYLERREEFHAARIGARDWIGLNWRYLAADGVLHSNPTVPFLALTYFDRCITGLRIHLERPPDDNRWLRLFLTCCIITAHTTVGTPGFYVARFKEVINHDFNDAEEIRPMLEYIYDTIDERRETITAFSYLNHLIYTVLHGTIPNTIDLPDLRIRARRRIDDTYRSCRLLHFRPSIIAGSALLRELETCPNFQDIIAIIMQDGRFDSARFISCFNAANPEGLQLFPLAADNDNAPALADEAGNDAVEEPNAVEGQEDNAGGVNDANEGEEEQEDNGGELHDHDGEQHDAEDEGGDSDVDDRPVGRRRSRRLSELLLAAGQAVNNPNQNANAANPNHHANAANQEEEIGDEEDDDDSDEEDDDSDEENDDPDDPDYDPGHEVANAANQEEEIGGEEDDDDSDEEDDDYDGENYDSDDPDYDPGHEVANAANQQEEIGDEEEDDDPDYDPGHEIANAANQGEETGDDDDPDYEG